MDFSRKNKGRGGVDDIFFEKNPGFSKFAALPLELQDKMNLHPWKFSKIVLQPSKIPLPKRKTPGNSTLFCLFTLEIPFFFN